MSLHSSGIRAINKIIHIDDEVLVIKLFALVSFDQADHLLALVEQSFLCFFCLVVRIFVCIKLQKPNKVVQEVVGYVEVCPTDVVLLVKPFEEWNLFGGHQVIQAHEQQSVTAESLHFALHIDKISIDRPVLDQVAEFENVLILGIQSEHLTVFQSIIIVDDNVH